MTNNIFLYLPENDDNFLKLIENDNDNSLISNLVDILNVIKDNPNVHLHYSPTNITSFIAKSNEAGLDSKKYKNDILVKLQKNSAKSINQNLEYNDIYFLWKMEENFSVEQGNELIGNLYEYLSGVDADNNVTVVDLFNSLACHNSKLILFKDSFIEPALPQNFIHVHSAISKIDLLNWIDKNDIFSLYNTAKYQKIGKEYHGKPIFKSLDDNTYWYLDNFHKNHYEVFNGEGKHMGEADMSGKLIGNKDPKKTIDLS